MPTRTRNEAVRSTRISKLWREWVRPFVLVVAVLATFRSAVADWNDVPTGSMKPTILNGDRVFVNKLAYGLRLPFTSWWISQWADPKGGDVVICFSPANGVRLVKRVIGVPGDRIEMRSGKLVINGESLAYAPLEDDIINQIDPSVQSQHRFAAETISEHKHAVMWTPKSPVPRSFDPITVPPGRYFVMGDNRDNSADSRRFGFVDRDQIVGRSSGTVLSLNPKNYYLPRWERFFRSFE